MTVTSHARRDVSSQTSSCDRLRRDDSRGGVVNTVMRAPLAALAIAIPLIGVSAPARTLVAGPALAGDRVVWGEQRAQTTVLVAAGGGPLLWRSSLSWLSGPLAASPSTVAFATSSNSCSAPNTACPVETTFVAGRPGHGWTPVTAPVRCVSTAAGRTLAVSGPLVATVTPDCDAAAAGTAVVRENGRVVFRRAVSCCDVALAGQTLAWRSGGAIDVFDLATHRLRYRAAAPPEGPVAAFDVQADGTLAMLVGRQPDGHVTVVWRRAADPTLHRLQLHAVLPTHPPGLRVIGDRLVLETAPAASPTDNIASSTLVVADLAGRTRVLARFSARLEQVGGFDATARTVTWASRRITRTRLDCPTTAQGAACLIRKTGVLTIWRVATAGGRAHAAASWPFTDAP
jgi:hypothetical protein